MAFKSWLNPSGTLLLLLISGVHCNDLTVDPPEDITISDPGHLGYLEITWSPPRNLINRTDFTTMYQLEYYNTYKGRWSLLRTSRRTYSAQFDMMKDVRVRVYTLLSGDDPNNLIMSKNYTELIQKPQTTGVMGTEVRNFTCVYHNMEYVECNWTNNPKMPPNSKQSLYFWYKELEKALECPQYIPSDGERSGCNFTGKSLPEFTNINFCVNGSSQQGPLKPTFTSLQIQNYVKPATAKKLDVLMSSDTQLELHWESPDGRVPAHCLQWEVELHMDGKTKMQTSDKTRLTVSVTDNNERIGFRVRSKIHEYCADDGFWSEWSHLSQKEMTEADLHVVPVYTYIAIAILAIMVLSLCVGAVFKLKKPRQEEKLGFLLTNLLNRHTSAPATEV